MGTIVCLMAAGALCFLSGVNWGMDPMDPEDRS